MARDGFGDTVPSQHTSTTSIDVSVDADKAKFSIPSWAIKPPTGVHLDVLKNDQLIQKILIDEKRAYYFGRNPKQVDIVVEHASCSRVHALMLYHGTLKRFALVDMGSSHGSYYGKIRLDPLKAIFMEPGATFHFGASSRRYVIREKLEALNKGDEDDSKDVLPNEDEIEGVTEYNTAQNRRILQLPISLEEARRKKRPRGNVAFLEQEEIINPEDVDPSVGRFRNLVTTAVISSGSGAQKRPNQTQGNPNEPARKIVRPGREALRFAAPMASTLGGISLNAAPDLELYSKTLPEPGVHHLAPVSTTTVEDDDEPHKKKYAKESWPGRKPNQPVL